MKSTIYHPMESIDHLQRQVFIDEVVVNLNHMHYNKNVPVASSSEDGSVASSSKSSSKTELGGASRSGSMTVDDLEYHITFPSDDKQHPHHVGYKVNSKKSTACNNNKNVGEAIVSDAAAFDAPETAVEVPVVVLLGWYGCQDKHLSKYSKIYEDLGCITIRFLPRADLLTYQSDSLRSIAAKLFEVIDEYRLESHQLILHMFSNGGCYVYRHVCNLLASSSDTKKKVSSKGASSSSSVQSGSYGVNEEQRRSRYEQGLRIRGCIFDSGPAVTSPLHLFRAIAAASPSANIVYRWVRSVLLMFAVLFAAVVEFLLGFIWSESKRVSPQSLWNTLAKDRARYPQLFLYSKADEICHYKSIKNFAEERRKCGVDVSEVCWEDSPHVKHFIIHRSEYVDRVVSFVQKCLNVELNPTRPPAAETPVARVVVEMLAEEDGSSRIYLGGDRPDTP